MGAGHVVAKGGGDMQRLTRKLIGVLVALGLAGFPAHGANVDAETSARGAASMQRVFAFVGGRWFDGERFVDRTAWSVDGVFVDAAPVNVDETVYLDGLYVVPPFGDAHAHHFDNPAIFPRIDAMYLAAGIFYGISMTNSVRGMNNVAPLTARRGTIDVAWANAGVTATLGHPIMVYETLARGLYRFDTSTVEFALAPKALGDAYVIVDTADDLATRWAAVTASSPDLVKIYLMFSEDFEVRRDRDDTYGDRGLDPALVPAIVARARNDGLRVAAHVETAADFRVAVDAGVDIVAHLPGYSPHREVPLMRYRIDRDVAERAAKAGVTVVPTPLGSARSRYAKDDPAFYASVRKLYVDNIRMLADAGVPMAIGSDTYFSTPAAEVEALADLGIFSPRELLAMWSVVTPQLAFPDRRIGRLDAGYEASFVALRGDPLVDPGAMARVVYRFKEGSPVGPAASSSR